MLVQEELVNKLSFYLPQNAIIYLSSDSNRVILWMINKFLQNKSFKLVKHSDIINNIDNHFQSNILTNLLIEEGKNNKELESIQNNENLEEINEEENNNNENNNHDNDNNDNDKNEEENAEIEETELIKLYNDYWISYNPLVKIYLIFIVVIFLF